MATHDHPAPRQYKGVTVSSTFRDLQEHREALMDILTGQGLFPVAMEHDSARLVDVIDSSLQKVREGAAYVGIISHRYGQVPECPTRNPDRLSITELEFDEAQRLERPILLFVMGDDHRVRPSDVEFDEDRRNQLEAFRERAKRMSPDSRVDRVYATFDNLEQFKARAARAVAELDQYLQAQAPSAAPEPAPLPERAPTSGSAPIPAPPAFYAEPPYIGSHAFVGRKAELDRLSDWAAPADPHSVLLFEAIGGTGKSMLTWEWTTKHATAVRGDWAGRFWYSFYEKGAVMADFCRRAVAYITGRPLEELRKKKTPELSDLLLRHLQARPWLLVLDGLERVLVAYHRYDAAQVADEEAGTSDQIAHRDPCNAIRTEDDELLRMLAVAAPSKLLLTTRLTPRVLLNRSNQTIPGVLRVPLPGLRPPDAEALLRSCGINGTSQEIQNYLKTHCDCHPLVTGVLAGLINDYLPGRGNFNEWAADNSVGGGRLNLAELDLVQKRNHILSAAISALPEKSRILLSTLAILSESVDYDVLSALNPHLPNEMDSAPAAKEPAESRDWRPKSDDQQREAQLAYHEARREHEVAAAARNRAPERIAATQELRKTVRDLEGRGLLQYDHQARRYDLHPVVRGVAAGRLPQEEREEYGQRAVDYFSQQAHDPYEETETLDDVLNGVRVVRILLHMGQEQRSSAAYRDLSQALLFNLEANVEVLSLLRPFFPHGWHMLPTGVSDVDAMVLANEAGIVLARLGQADSALMARGASIVGALRSEHWSTLHANLVNMSVILADQNRLAREDRCMTLSLELAKAIGDDAGIFASQLSRFDQLVQLGRTAEAEEVWDLLERMGRDWPRAVYRPGDAEASYAVYRFWRGDACEEDFARAGEYAKAGKNRITVRSMYWWRAEWHIIRHQWANAAGLLREAIRMAHEVGQMDAASEARLALCRFHLGQLPNPQLEAERLADIRRAGHGMLADLWLAIGDREQAAKHALAAYKWAWADGEPYVYRYELDRARGLLEQLGAEVPDLPAYDPVKEEKFTWEDEVVAAIEQIRGEKEAAAEEAEDEEKDLT
jgi:hypothetical protein